jgi:hypothetical protein
MGVIINGSLNNSSVNKTDIATAITINTYCKVNRNGSININTDPTFPQPLTPYTGPICVSGVAVANETYTFIGYQTFNGYTSPVYQSPGPFFYSIDNSTANGTYIICSTSGERIELYEGLTFPAPSNPYLETQWVFYGTLDPAPITVTSGSC